MVKPQEVGMERVPFEAGDEIGRLSVKFRPLLPRAAQPVGSVTHDWEP